jgi:hypothetical protein
MVPHNLTKELDEAIRRFELLFHMARECGFEDLAAIARRDLALLRIVRMKVTRRVAAPAIEHRSARLG